MKRAHILVIVVVAAAAVAAAAVSMPRNSSFSFAELIPRDHSAAWIGDHYIHAQERYRDGLTDHFNERFYVPPEYIRAVSTCTVRALDRRAQQPRYGVPRQWRDLLPILELTETERNQTYTRSQISAAHATAAGIEVDTGHCVEQLIPVAAHNEAWAAFNEPIVAAQRQRMQQQADANLQRINENNSRLAHNATCRSLQSTYDYYRTNSILDPGERLLRQYEQRLREAGC